MPRGGLPALAGLTVGDPPAVWEALGFSAGPGDTVVLGGVSIQLAGPGVGRGITGWTLRAADLPASDIDGILTAALAPAAGAPAAPEHPNGAIAIDHVVVATPDLPRTVRAMEDAGLELRRVREAAPELHQAFLWAGEVLVEVAGPPRPGEGAEAGPARLWGLTVVAPDLARVTALSDPLVGTVRTAVQEGRWIVTVRREAGSTTRLAFMTPHPQR